MVKGKPQPLVSKGLSSKRTAAKVSSASPGPSVQIACKPQAFMLMRRNVAAGIGSNEQGEYCRAALQRSVRKEPRYKCPTLLFFLSDQFVQLL